MSSLWYPSVKQYPLSMSGTGGIVGGLNFQSAGNESAWYNLLEQGAGGYEQWYGVAVDDDYIYTCGRTNAAGQGGTEGLVAKYDKDGVINLSPIRNQIFIVPDSSMYWWSIASVQITC